MKKLSMTLSAPTVALSGGKGTLTASVTNGSPTTERVILGAFPADPATGTGTPSPIATVSEPLRSIPPGATVQYEVAFDVSTSEPGSHPVKLIPYSAEEAPEDYAELTHVVQLDVPEPAVAPPAAKRRIPWWVWAIAAGVLVIIGVVAFFLLRPGPPPPPTDSPTPSETVELELSALSPTQGPIAGGTVVQLIGRFVEPTIVSFGDAQLVAVRVSDTEYTFTTPAVETAGQVPLLVESGGQRLAVGLFEYKAPEPTDDGLPFCVRFPASPICNLVIQEEIEPGIIIDPELLPQFDPEEYELPELNQ